jgi:hypothetical protein
MQLTIEKVTKSQKDKQWSQNITQKTQNRATRTLLKTDHELGKQVLFN